MAHGKIRTGFSCPWVALYHNSDGAVTYSKGMRLARGVSVSIDVTASEDNNFYADNVAAEKAPGVFTGGSVAVTVDGLKADAEMLIFGLPEAEEVDVGDQTVRVRKYNDAMQIPYVGIAFITRYLEDGVTTYVPTILRKAQFNTPGEEAQTQEEDLEWQTQELTAELMRDDSALHDWKWKGEDLPTEAEAEAVIKAVFNVQ